MGAAETGGGLRPAAWLIAARGGVEKPCGSGFDRLPAEVKQAENSKDSGVSKSDPGGQRQGDYGEHCERHCER